MMILYNTADILMAELKQQYPDAPDCPPEMRPQMLAYQLMALYGLATRYNIQGASILEIGTGFGASTFMLSKAAPLAMIVSLSASVDETEIALKSLQAAGCINVQVAVQMSWDRLAQYTGPELDMVFVDGDHLCILRDMPWWNWIKVGGLMCWHDYSPRACPPILAAVNAWAKRLGRLLDVFVTDDVGIGFAGMYRHEGETWQTIAP
jgi:predicted O-methyltransferase YrrM